MPEQCWVSVPLRRLRREVRMPVLTMSSAAAWSPATVPKSTTTSRARSSSTASGCRSSNNRKLMSIQTNGPIHNNVQQTHLIIYCTRILLIQCNQYKILFTSIFPTNITDQHNHIQHYFLTPYWPKQKSSISFSDIILTKHLTLYYLLLTKTTTHFILY